MGKVVQTQTKLILRNHCSGVTKNNSNEISIWIKTFMYYERGIILVEKINNAW